MSDEEKKNPLGRLEPLFENLDALFFLEKLKFLEVSKTYFIEHSDHSDAFLTICECSKNDHQDIQRNWKVLFVYDFPILSGIFVLFKFIYCFRILM